MSPGYGNRIYKKRKNHALPLLLALSILVMVVLFLKPGFKTPPPQGDSSQPENNQQLPNRLPGFPEEKNRSSSRLPLTAKAKDTEVASGAENPLSQEPDGDLAIEQSRFQDRENLEFLSLFHFKQKQYRKALQGFLELMKSDDRFSLPVGQCYYFLEEYEKARSCLLNAVRSVPDDFLAKKFLALTWYRLDRFDESLRLTREALVIQKDPELQAFHRRLLREVENMKGYADRKTPGFKIIFSQYEHSEIRFKVMEILKAALRKIGREMNHYLDRDLTVILYNERGFFDITRAPHWAGGLYDGKIRIPIKGAGRQEPLLKRVLFHEYAHALIRDMAPDCPLWLNEGLAEYFSQEHHRTIGQVIPLQNLEKRFPGGDPRLVAVAYLQSYSVVAYLISKYGLYRIKELLLEMGKGNDFSAAFQTVFFQSYQDFLRKWGRS